MNRSNSTGTDSLVVLKLTFQGRTFRKTCSKDSFTWGQFLRWGLESFGTQVVQASSLLMTYEDEEGDHPILASDADLQEAMDMALRMQRSLRILMEENNQDASSCLRSPFRVQQQLGRGASSSSTSSSSSSSSPASAFSSSIGAEGTTNVGMSSSFVEIPASSSNPLPTASEIPVQSVKATQAEVPVMATDKIEGKGENGNSSSSASATSEGGATAFAAGASSSSFSSQQQQEGAGTSTGAGPIPPLGPIPTITAEVLAAIQEGLAQGAYYDPSGVTERVRQASERVLPPLANMLSQPEIRQGVNAVVGDAMQLASCFLSNLGNNANNCNTQQEGGGGGASSTTSSTTPTPEEAVRGLAAAFAGANNFGGNNGCPQAAGTGPFGGGWRGRFRHHFPPHHHHPSWLHPHVHHPPPPPPPPERVIGGCPTGLTPPSSVPPPPPPYYHHPPHHHPSHHARRYGRQCHRGGGGRGAFCGNTTMTPDSTTTTAAASAATTTNEVPPATIATPVQQEKEKEEMACVCCEKGGQGEEGEFYEDASSSGGGGGAAAAEGEGEVPVHWGVRCDKCRKANFAGVRYKDAVRRDFDLCEECEASEPDWAYPLLKIRDPSQAPAAIVTVLPPESEITYGNDATRTHSGVTCDGCDMSPIVGSRFNCTRRHDYDLCGTCEAQDTTGFPMLKISKPSQAPAFLHVTPQGTSRPRWSRRGALRRCWKKNAERSQREVNRRQQASAEGGGGASATTNDLPEASAYATGINVDAEVSEEELLAIALQLSRDKYAMAEVLHQQQASSSPSSPTTPSTTTMPVAEEVQQAQQQGGEATEQVTASTTTTAAAAVPPQEEESTAEEEPSTSSTPSQQQLKASNSNRNANEVSAPTTTDPSTTTSTTSTTTSTSTTNNSRRAYSARFISDGTFPDGTVVQPSMELRKTWVMTNNGTLAFPSDTRLVFAYGHLMDGPTAGVLVGAVAPGKDFSITVPLVAPAENNQYIGCWHLQGTNAETGEVMTIGNRIWVDLTVDDDGWLLLDDAAASALTASQQGRESVEEEKISTDVASGNEEGEGEGKEEEGAVRIVREEEEEAPPTTSLEDSLLEQAAAETLASSSSSSSIPATTTTAMDYATIVPDVSIVPPPSTTTTTIDNSNAVSTLPSPFTAPAPSPIPAQDLPTSFSTSSTANNAVQWADQLAALNEMGFDNVDRCVAALDRLYLASGLDAVVDDLLQ